ncbi:MAG TPA: NADH-quinone oxidoreductase subunit H [Draconibacterium sp.]|nr:NADH-quinone oxidoreductase subunit H [Draconibacterium sp.]
MILNPLVIILVSLVFPGVIALTKARIAGRKGASVLQPFSDNIRLFRKGNVFSTTTSWIFQVAPAIYFSTVFMALLFIPLGKQSAIFSFEGDFVLFAYLLAFGKFMMIAAAMDTGSGFEGMGANREAFYSLLVEPAFFIVIASMALLTNHTSFYDLFNNLHIESQLLYLIAILSVYIFLWIAMVENSRLPVDDPKTHLELTMVHEVMVLDFSGFDLALIQLANGLKFAIYGALIFNFVLPMQDYFAAQLVIFFIIEFIFAISVGAVESFRARNKMAKNAQWIISLTALAILGFLSVLIITGKIILLN